MYAIPRPRTRAECLEEARPCPWVGCVHHNLIEVLKAKRGSRSPSLVLNRMRKGSGRRKALRSSDAAVLVRAWIDDAVEELMLMQDSCSLDVVRDLPDGISQRQVGKRLGISEQAVHEEEHKPHVRNALEKLRDFLRR